VCGRAGWWLELAVPGLAPDVLTRRGPPARMFRERWRESERDLEREEEGKSKGIVQNLRSIPFSEMFLEAR